LNSPLLFITLFGTVFYLYFIRRQKLINKDNVRVGIVLHAFVPFFLQMLISIQCPKIIDSRIQILTFIGFVVYLITYLYPFFWLYYIVTKFKYLNLKGDFKAVLQMLLLGFICFLRYIHLLVSLIIILIVPDIAHGLSVIRTFDIFIYVFWFIWIIFVCLFLKIIFSRKIV
jgi:hypothetical protein